ncbi:hypothetical protein ACHAW6_002994 [Cyclotella cf. meneghiniana]
MATVPPEDTIPSIERNESFTVNRDGSLFDDVIDPFEQIAISERRNGQIAGRRAGYSEGRDIGRSKAWEIGLELGYIHSFARHVLKNVHQQRLDQINKPNDRFSKRLNRCLAISQELKTLINQFPDPDSLFDRYQNIADNIDSNKKKFDDTSTDHFETGANVADVEDVTSSLQRIRAKFKLLLVLLSTTRPFGLKRLLDTNESCFLSQLGNGAGSEEINTNRDSAGLKDDW